MCNGLCCCAVLKCPMLETSNANVSTTVTYPGTRVIVDCHVGSRINNVYQQMTLTCNATAQWLPSNVTCKRMTYLYMYLYCCCRSALPPRTMPISGSHEFLYQLKVAQRNWYFLIERQDVSRRCKNSHLVANVDMMIYTWITKASFYNIIV